MNTAIVMYENEKSSAAAHAIGQAYFKRGESAKAEQYYNEAISLEESNTKKADMYYELGLLYFTGMNNYQKAYLLIGRVYAAGGKDCGNDEFENKWVYWVVVDQFQKAKSVDPSVSEEANKLISTYSAYFPKENDAFWADMKAGQTVTVGCWINETTTARFIK